MSLWNGAQLFIINTKAQLFVINIELLRPYLFHEGLVKMETLSKDKNTQAISHSHSVMRTGRHTSTALFMQEEKKILDLI